MVDEWLIFSLTNGWLMADMIVVGRRLMVDLCLAKGKFMVDSDRSSQVTD